MKHEMESICSSKLIIDNEKVRVTRFDFEPKQETGWHMHKYDYLITAITDCSMLLNKPDGTNEKAEILNGSIYAREAGVHHNVINVSDKLMSFIEIELKSE